MSYEQIGGPPITFYQRLAQRRSEADEKLCKAVLDAVQEYNETIEVIKVDSKQWKEG